MFVPHGQRHPHATGTHPSAEPGHEHDARDHQHPLAPAPVEQEPPARALSFSSASSWASRLPLPPAMTLVTPAAPTQADSTMCRPSRHSMRSRSSSDRASYNSYSSIASWQSYPSSTSSTASLPGRPPLSSMHTSSSGGGMNTTGPYPSTSSNDVVSRPLSRTHLTLPPIPSGGQMLGKELLPGVVSPSHPFSLSPIPTSPRAAATDAPAQAPTFTPTAASRSVPPSASFTSLGPNLNGFFLRPGTRRHPYRRSTFTSLSSRRNTSSASPATRNLGAHSVPSSSTDLLSPEGELSQPVYPPLSRPRLSNLEQYCLTDRSSPAPSRSLGLGGSRSQGSLDSGSAEDPPRPRLPPIDNAIPPIRVRGSSASTTSNPPSITPRPLPPPPLPTSSHSSYPLVPPGRTAYSEEDPLLGLQRLTLDLYGLAHSPSTLPPPAPPPVPPIPPASASAPAPASSTQWNPNPVPTPHLTHHASWPQPTYDSTLAYPNTLRSGRSGASDSGRDEYEQPGNVGVKRGRRGMNSMPASASTPSLTNVSGSTTTGAPVTTTGTTGTITKRKLGRPRNVSRDRLLTILSSQDDRPTPSVLMNEPPPSSSSGPGPLTASRTTSATESKHTLAAETSATGMSVCTYLHPLTGTYCGTEFHRLYDLARHRETIHAKEEAKAVRRGQMTMEQALVWGKEVDPSSSSITKEWVCHKCDSVFSRKDALLRHKRSRHGT